MIDDPNLTEEERDDFGHALMVLISIVRSKMSGSLVGTVGYGVVGSDEELGLFHVNIHDANLCMDDDAHTPRINHDGTGTVQ